MAAFIWFWSSSPCPPDAPRQYRVAIDPVSAGYGPFRAWFAKRVCVLGAESTGTTTLAKALAADLNTTWVPEFGREYSERKLARNVTIWRTDEFTMIAQEQQRREESAARNANRILICDTNAFATTLWHRRYVGSNSRSVEQIAKEVRCDLYFLTGFEIPFVQDGLRDGEHSIVSRPSPEPEFQCSRFTETWMRLCLLRRIPGSFMSATPPSAVRCD